MCGIAGILGPAGTLDLVRVMTDAQSHRGPDDAGLELIPTQCSGSSLALGHRRLSILDLSPAGHQPMTLADTGNWLVYNGEIYNHQDLRKELPGPFHSSCDTETILQALSHWGYSSIDRFRGMFAFAHWDPRRQELFLCRDRLGVKPLYYAQIGPNFLFASEIRALLATQLIPRRLDTEGLNGYLAFGSAQEPATLIRDIRLLPAGHWLRVTPEHGIIEQHCYWRPPFVESLSDVSLPKVHAEISGRLDDAVGCRLLSDVPLGAFLSGGIDSTAIVAAMAHRQHNDINTFTLNFTEKDYGEGSFAEMVARKYQTSHVTEPVSASDLLAHFSPALDASDQPSIDGINTYYVCKIARQSGLTVALCGHGGDELFAGYDNFRLIPRVLNFRLIPKIINRLLSGALASWPAPRVATLKATSLLAEPIDIFTSYALARSVFWDHLRQGLLADPHQLIPAHRLLRTNVPSDTLSADPVNQVSQLELTTYLRNTLLRDADVCSMAHGLEIRVPFLDHHLVDYVTRIPGRFKVSGQAPKRLLVNALGDDIPPEIHLRRKQGFVIPYQLWMRTELRPVLDETLRDRANAESLGLNPTTVEKIWSAFLSGSLAVNMQHPLALYILLRWCARHGVTA